MFSALTGRVVRNLLCNKTHIVGWRPGNGTIRDRLLEERTKLGLKKKHTIILLCLRGSLRFSWERLKKEKETNKNSICSSCFLLVMNHSHRLKEVWPCLHWSIRRWPQMNVSSPWVVKHRPPHWADPSDSRKPLPGLDCKAFWRPSLSSRRGRRTSTIWPPEPFAPEAPAAPRCWWK